LHAWHLVYCTPDAYKLIYEDPEVKAYLDMGDELLSRDYVLCVLAETDEPAAELIRKGAH